MRNRFFINLFRKQSAHCLVGLPSGNLLLVGGSGVWPAVFTAIWLLKDDVWTKIGDLQTVNLKTEKHKQSFKPNSSGSAITINNAVFIFSGTSPPYPIQRLDFEGDELVNNRVIAYSENSYIPILFEAPADYCV